jgi:hypothetical protein
MIMVTGVMSPAPSELTESSQSRFSAPLRAAHPCALWDVTRRRMAGGQVRWVSGSRKRLRPVRARTCWGVSHRHANFATQSRLKCGARTRRGTPLPVQSRRGWRCRLHGGLSTGPKTPEGRTRIAEAQWKRWAARREQRDLGKPPYGQAVGTADLSRIM